jgi:hypothetical protein
MEDPSNATIVGSITKTNIFDVEYGLSGNNSQELAIDFDVRLLVIKHHF